MIRRIFFKFSLNTSFLFVCFNVLKAYTRRERERERERESKFNPNPTENKNVFKLIKEAYGDPGPTYTFHDVPGGGPCAGTSFTLSHPSFPTATNYDSKQTHDYWGGRSYGNENKLGTAGWGTRLYNNSSCPGHEYCNNYEFLQSFYSPGRPGNEYWTSTSRRSTCFGTE